MGVPGFKAKVYLGSRSEVKERLHFFEAASRRPAPRPKVCTVKIGRADGKMNTIHQFPRYETEPEIV